MPKHDEVVARIREIAPELRLAVYLRDGFACVYCGESLAEEAVLVLDHVRPRFFGGTSTADNLVTCCDWCNGFKRELTYRAFRVFLEDIGRLPPGLDAKLERALATPIEPYLDQARAQLTRAPG